MDAEKKDGGAEPLSITEAELADKLGVARETLLEIRTVQLTVEKDWARKKNAIVYFQSGIELACAALGVAVPSAILSAAAILEGTNNGDQGGPRTVFVKRPARLNGKMIFATDDEDGEGAEIPVRVREARLFTPGQEIHITPAGADGVATLHGPQPRQRGRNRLPGRARPRTA